MKRVEGGLANALQQEGNDWRYTLVCTPFVDPICCCVGCVCPCILAYRQRREMLNITKERYVCCAGICLCCTKPWEDQQPVMCVESCSCCCPYAATWATCLESCLCPHAATLGNRYMMQTRFNVRNDRCDNNLLSVAACCNLLADCWGACASAESGAQLKHLTDCLHVVLCSCMLVQQQLQLSDIMRQTTANGYEGPKQKVMEELPPKQRSMAQSGIRSPSQPIHRAELEVVCPPETGSGDKVHIETPHGGRCVEVPSGAQPGDRFKVDLLTLTSSLA